MTTIQRSFAIACLILFVSACATKKTIDASSAESIIASVNKGDSIKVTTRNDVTHKFEVTRITNKALYGDNARVEYDNMAKVEIVNKNKSGERKKPEKETRGFWDKLF